MRSALGEKTFINDFKHVEVDARITYPCYKSFDEFIDVERLRSLDGYIIERINRHIKAEMDSFFLNIHRLDADSPYQPGVREIWLTRTKPDTPYDSLDLDRDDLWELPKPPKSSHC